MLEVDSGRYHLSPLIDVAVGSVINQFTFGFRFIGEARKEFDEMKAVMDEQMQGFVHPITSIVLAMPTLRHLPVFSYYFKLFEKELLDSMAFLIVKLRKQSGNGKKETTSNTLKFLVLYMIVFPEVQTKMQQELDRVIGDNEDGSKRICLADKVKLPYTNAVIHETQRFCNLLPMNLLHRTTKDVECGGFKIAKGTKIVPVISSVLYDERIFPEPTNLSQNALFKMDSSRNTKSSFHFL
uniref:Cytochrome P450 n=1 Tax=Ditylenchus dipsaci TaxID=166011 RepID=A0A915DCI0_9BILA